MGDTESCSSRAVDLALSQSRNRRQKFEVYNDVLCRLKHYNDEEACVPDFEDELWSHFQRLPTRYALDVNVERAQDVLMHKRLLQTAHNPATRPAIEVRLVQVHSALEVQCGVQGVFCSDNPNLPCVHPPPAFGSLPDAEPAHNAQDTDVTRIASPQCCSRLMHEITISTLDKPKLLSQLTSLLSDIGLNIQEAHAFSTTDGYSLDVFVVDNWSPEETEELRSVVLKEIPKIEKHDGIKPHIIYPVGEQEQTTTSISNRVNIPSDRLDVWEIDVNLLKYENKIASGSYGDLYKGTFCSQDVAIKVLRTEHLNDKLRREFAQEVFIMRKIRHKNVVQFIGASTRPPKLCIVTEYMCGGSMYDFLHKQKRKLNLKDLIRVAIDVSKGMSYLHQNNIIHRDLKAANLLIDENGVVKVADFGVARVQDESGVMTAETGTYRWMAPEVIAHRPYDHKADVFSFSIVLWELLTGKLPYEQLTPLQAAVGVAQQGLRPLIPSNTHPQLVQLLENCWQQNPLMRPGFSEILDRLQELARMVTDQIKDRQRKKSSTKMLRGERQQNN